MSVLQVKQRAPEIKAKALRKAGMVPMAVVQKGGETLLVQAPVNDVKRALAAAHGAGMIDVSVDGAAKPVSVVVKSIDRDILSRTLSHVTVQQVNKDDTIRVDIPVIALGTPQAVTDGEAILVHPMDHVKVKGKISEIPDSIEVDISGLAIHESITAGQVQLPEGVELVSSPDSQLFSVTFAKEPELETSEGEESAEVPTVGESTSDSSE
jgi:large subunit ribosomal protein L25